MSKIKNGGLDQYGVEPFEQQQFGTAGVEGLRYIKYGAADFCLTHFVCPGKRKVTTKQKE